ncbi:MAG: phosphatase PAP2 family protein [Clostridia bacterium]|nr:phosphatase PAP2 family protein [Clostridia bacterium]
MDIAILKWVHQVFHDQTWLNYIMKYVTYLGEFGAGAIICAIALLIFKKTRWAGVAVACACVLDVLIVNVILKLSVNRARPWQTYPDLGFQEFHLSIGVREPSDSSFPSGHTAALFAAAVALTMYYKVKGLPAIAVALLVAISRIYLCMHYPTDVLGGMFIGAACGVGGYFLMKAGKKYIWPEILKLFSKKKSEETPPEEQITEQQEDTTEIKEEQSEQ